MGLLFVEWMCDLPCPPRTRRKEGVSDSHWRRFLCRKHVQRILGWKERLAEGDPAGFSDAVNLLIRTKFYPEADPNRDGEVIGGNQERCPPAKSPTIDNHATTRSGEGGCCGDKVCISQVDVTEHLVPVMGECPPIASQEEFFPPGARDRNKRGRVRGHGSRLASREILADIAHNVLSNDQRNGADLFSTMERNDA